VMVVRSVSQGLAFGRGSKEGASTRRILDQIGGKVTLGGLERWFSPRGQDLAFLLSCIGLVRPSSSADLKQNKTKQTNSGPTAKVHFLLTAGFFDEVSV
jgi:hypothetical protein